TYELLYQPEVDKRIVMNEAIKLDQKRSTMINKASSLMGYCRVLPIAAEYFFSCYESAAFVMGKLYGRDHQGQQERAKSRRRNVTLSALLFT
ncbi:MAG: hypothetical protein U5K84_07355, partial [Alkalibacterium sp.]|nr:hypothetical protein [Alkalibacterium sp.]